MRARRRVVTVTSTGPKRQPTVRKIKSAIVPAPPKPRAADGGTPPAGPGAPSTSPARYDDPGPGPDPGVDLSVDLGRGLRLANPILVASGTFGYGV